MNVKLKNPVLIVAVIALAVVVAFALGPSLVASAQCQKTRVAGDSDSSAGCATMGSGDGCGGMKMDGMHGPRDCAMLSGKITSVNTKDGTLAVRLTPDSRAGERVKSAIGQAKVGDKIAVVVMVTKDGRLASQSPHAAEKSAYVCPMHPNETSDGAAKCSVCGMSLVPRGEASEDHAGHGH